MKFSKALVTLAFLFHFDQAAAAVVTSTRSADGSIHVVIPFGNGDDNGNDRKKERKLETTAHDADARSLSDVTVPYGPGGFCLLCDRLDHQCSNDDFGYWNNGERDFVDPLNVSINSIKVEVFGMNCGSVGPIEVSLNGNILGELTSMEELCINFICRFDDVCDSSSATFTIDSQWYNVGGSNTIKLRPTNGSEICVDRVELDLFEETDDQQCKKQDPENDICSELGGLCKVDCEDDEDFVCVPGLCSYDRNWDKPTKSPKMRELKEEEVDVVDIEVTADGSTERKLKGTKAPSTKETKDSSSKAPKATKAPKSSKPSCECRVPRERGCEI